MVRSRFLARKKFIRKPKKAWTVKAYKPTRMAVKKQILGMAETKHKYMTFSGNMLDNSFYFENINYWIGQGTGDFQRVGDKIFVKYVNFKINILDIPANVGDTDIKVVVWIVKTRDATRAGTLAPSWAYWSVSPGPIKAGLNSTYAQMDTERYTWIKTKRIVIPRNQITNTPRWAQFSMNWSVNANWLYDSDNGGYLRSGSYYLMAAVQSIDNSPGSSIVNFTATVDLAYKDM